MEDFLKESMNYLAHEDGQVGASLVCVRIFVEPVIVVDTVVGGSICITEDFIVYIAATALRHFMRVATLRHFRFFNDIFRVC